VELAGKTILVTGATDGIGAELARQLRARGAQIIAAGRDPARLAEAQAAGCDAIRADLATLAGVDDLLTAVAGREIDILINNAGMGDGGHDFRSADPDVARASQTIQLNLATPIALITGLMPVLRARARTTGGAMIVNVTSGLAIAPSGASPVYCATKAALRAYTQSLRAQLRGTGIAVVEALPPLVDTRMTAARRQRKMPASTCAEAIVRGMEARREEIAIGAVQALKAIHSLSPALARRIMLRF